jgi:hypothetical protein
VLDPVGTPSGYNAPNAKPSISKADAKDIKAFTSAAERYHKALEDVKSAGSGAESTAARKEVQDSANALKKATGKLSRVSPDALSVAGIAEYNIICH